MTTRLGSICTALLLTACGSSSDSAGSAPGPYSGPPTLGPTSNAVPGPYGGPPTLGPTSNAVPAAMSNRSAVREADFVAVASDPFSTFAADVDSASYDIFRRSLASHSLPAADEVRVEEYVNYFAYDYPAPELDAEVPFSIVLSGSAHVDDTRRTKLLRVGIQGAKPTQRPAANLVFLVDVSGSMIAANKLPLVKLVLAEVLDELREGDSVAIVSYASDTRVRLHPTPVGLRPEIERVIDRLEAGGSTNGGSGIQLAYEEAQRSFLDDGINHVILCTDGDFNLGLTSDDELVHLIKQKRASGVTLTALGFGERNNDSMMERVSDAGNGIYSVLYDEDQAIAYAHERLLSTMLHIAKDMKIQVEFNPDLVYAYRLIGYEDRAVADAQFRNDRVDGGEVGAGHRVTALFELALSEDDLPSGAPAARRGEATADRLEREIDVDDLVRVKVRWKRPGAAASDSASEVSSSLRPDDLAGDPEQLDADAQWAIGIARLAEIVRGSAYAERSEFPRVRALLEALPAERVDRRELLTLLPQVGSLFSRR